MERRVLVAIDADDLVRLASIQRAGSPGREGSGPRDQKTKIIQCFKANEVGTRYHDGDLKDRRAISRVWALLSDIDNTYCSTRTRTASGRSPFFMM